MLRAHAAMFRPPLLELQLHHRGLMVWQRARSVILSLSGSAVSDLPTIDEGPKDAAWPKGHHLSGPDGDKFSCLEIASTPVVAELLSSPSPKSARILRAAGPPRARPRCSPPRRRPQGARAQCVRPWHGWDPLSSSTILRREGLITWCHHGPLRSAPESKRRKSGAIRGPSRPASGHYGVYGGRRCGDHREHLTGGHRQGVSVLR
jgi:hypothetical protein